MPFHVKDDTKCIVMGAKTINVQYAIFDAIAPEEAHITVLIDLR